VGSERHVRNATKRIIAVQGQFTVIQGQPWSYLALFRRYGSLLVEKSPKSPVRTYPSLRNRPRSGWPLSNFVMNQIFLETRMFRLSDEEIMTLAFFVLIQYRSVTDRRTDRRTDVHLCSGYTSACIARYANALVKKTISEIFTKRCIVGSKGQSSKSRWNNISGVVPMGPGRGGGGAPTKYFQKIKKNL